MVVIVRRRRGVAQSHEFEPARFRIESNEYTYRSRLPCVLLFVFSFRLTMKRGYLNTDKAKLAFEKVRVGSPLDDPKPSDILPPR